MFQRSNEMIVSPENGVVNWGTKCQALTTHLKSSKYRTYLHVQVSEGYSSSQSEASEWPVD